MAECDFKNVIKILEKVNRKVQMQNRTFVLFLCLVLCTFEDVFAIMCEKGVNREPKENR